MAIRIGDTAAPASIDAPDSADFVAGIELANAVEALGYGTEELAHEPAEELSYFWNPHEPRRMIAAWVDDKMVSRGLYKTQAGEEADTAWLNVQVLPDFRGRGIGGTLAGRLESIAVADRRSKALVYTSIPGRSGPRLPSPTGFGSVSATHPATRFLLARGYRLEQVQRCSRLALPTHRRAERLATAVATSGPGYALHHWERATPDRWRADMATLLTRMSTDASSAGLEEPEDVWTTERLIETDQRDERMNPRTRITTAVEHVASGTLAGFSDLSLLRQSHRAVNQYATLVVKEHRGIRRCSRPMPRRTATC